MFANASLFHVPAQELPRVLGEIRATLRACGILFSSNPHGRNQEGWHDRRYGTYLDVGAWRAVMSSAGFVELEHYYRPDWASASAAAWLAMVWRKAARRCQLLEWCTLCDPRGVRRSERGVYNRLRCIV